MTARAIMFQGTGSSVGKSLLVTGLARALAKRDMRVRPFKPQNMSNNAAVTQEGGEIGRAQALQALAALVKPSVHMNPVLLKPQSEIGAQVIVQGKVFGQASAREMQGLKPKLLPFVLESFERLKSEADIVLIEGAGSASEINLRRNDIANMGFARAANVPVALIGDIDRGGVIASLVGTMEKETLPLTRQAIAGEAPNIPGFANRSDLRSFRQSTMEEVRDLPVPELLQRMRAAFEEHIAMLDTLSDSDFEPGSYVPVNEPENIIDSSDPVTALSSPIMPASARRSNSVIRRCSALRVVTAVIRVERWRMRSTI